jgi:rod shape-determining protein MreB
VFGLVPELGIDLGTANILVYAKGRGIVIHEPSVVAISATNGKILAVGEEARLMIGRTPGSIRAVRPLSNGVIADYTVTKEMLRYLIRKSLGTKLAVTMRPRILVCVPGGVTDVERRAVVQAAKEAGAREVGLIEETMAAAIGAGISIGEARGNMVVDIGGGTTDIAVISLGGIVASDSIRIAGNKMDEVIIRYIRNQFNLAIGDRTAEEIKVKIGSAYPLEPELSLDVRGRDMIEGLPKTVTVTSQEIREALMEPIAHIVNAVKLVLERTPPELSSDIIERGITLTGGGALLRGLDALLSLETHIPARVAEDALACVAIGTGRALQEARTIIDSAPIPIG